MNILKVLTERRKTGNIGEDAAARLLRKSGYKIIKRNFVAEGHEIDIIAMNREYFVFVEVKTRTRDKTSPFEPRPAASVDKAKMRAIITCARAFMSGEYGKRKMRFDIIEVYLDSGGKVVDTQHLISAFTADRL